MGFDVYVDWAVDHELDRTRVTEQTANALRYRMSQSQSLFFATSQNAVNSKWMPWELGFFDGHKHRAAILPVLSSGQITTRYEGREYLGIYPYISREKNVGGVDALWVHKDEDTYVRFEYWLEGTEPYKRD